MLLIDSFKPEDWKRAISRSNQTAMLKRHKYPRYEGSFLANCCTFQQAVCKTSCFCSKVGCKGIWTLRPNLEFELFLSNFGNLWVLGSDAFRRAVNDSGSKLPPRWRPANGIRLLREIKKRWSNWDENGNSLPAVVGNIRQCYFCDDSFARIAPIVETIKGLVHDNTGVYSSKVISQLFYDIAVPFDTTSAKKQRKCGYDPESYGSGKMQEEVRRWLLSNKKSIDDFRALDDAPMCCWSGPGSGTACSRVIDKLFYGHPPSKRDA